MTVEDPRVERTREHVLACAQQILVEGGARAVTFSELSRRARVSRNTLYRHWPTIEQLLVAATMRYHAAQDSRDGPPATAEAFLGRLRDRLQSGETRQALASLIDWAQHQPASAEVLRQVADARQQVLEAATGPLTEVQMAQIVGPLFYQSLLAQRPLDDDFIKGLLDSLRAQGLVPAQ